MNDITRNWVSDKSVFGMASLQVIEGGLFLLIN